jgi:hypothetical protein
MAQLKAIAKSRTLTREEILVFLQPPAPIVSAITDQMRIIRVFFAVLAGLWLCVALLRLFAAFHAPDSFDGAVARAIGYALVPLFLFCAIAFAGRPSRGGRNGKNRSESMDIVPPADTKTSKP